LIINPAHLPPRIRLGFAFSRGSAFTTLYSETKSAFEYRIG
jgi:hypothetical protein